jgi:metallo-beta-lactamase class B
MRSFPPPPLALGLALALGLGIASPLHAQEAGTGLGRIASAVARSQLERSLRAMNRPFEPFHVIGNIYYVGARDVSSFLITTREGHILIDSGLDETVPYIVEGVKKLGFRLEDVKLLLNSHAHLDHAGGHATLKRMTGARIVMSKADARLLEAGGKGDFLPLGDHAVSYTPVRADQLVDDLDEVGLGGVKLTAHLTPGHTKGCTTWTTSVAESGRRWNVVFAGGATLLPGIRLVNNSLYPEIADDYARTFRVLKTLPCDVFLAPHGFQFQLQEKFSSLRAGGTANPFIDPKGYRAFVERAEQVYRDQLRREQPDSK